MELSAQYHVASFKLRCGVRCPVMWSWKWWQKPTWVVGNTSRRYPKKDVRRQMRMAYSDKITHRPMHHIDPCPGHVYEHDPWGGRVYAVNTNEGTVLVVSHMFKSWPHKQKSGSTSVAYGDSKNNNCKQVIDDSSSKWQSKWFVKWNSVDPNSEGSLPGSTAIIPERLILSTSKASIENVL